MFFVTGMETLVELVFSVMVTIEDSYFVLDGGPLVQIHPREEKQLPVCHSLFPTAKLLSH